MNAFHIDAFEFSRLKESRGGVLAVRDLPRLAAELIEPAGELSWTLEGGADAYGHPRLHLTVRGPVQLRCQRCLGGMPFGIDSESVLLLGRDEAAADAIEALVDDDEVDVIVASANFDLLALIEDEAMLALPLAPRHERCPQDEVALPEGKAERESPFAVLKNLKQ